MKKLILSAFLSAVIFLQVHATDSLKTEFRAVWVATVDNIDWPESPLQSPEMQRASFIRLLDMHKANGMNAVIVQVRPSADAFYPSPFEPWSQWLTGVQGKAPFPFYDPLEFMVTETHKRGMQFHAWLNPYRAVFNIYRSSVTPNHVTRLHPEWFLTYGDKKYFDPGNKEVQKYVNLIVKDIVSRYRVDAIHLDDYFYPYRLPGREFPDEKSYRLYGNGMTRADWRRSNTDSIIALLSKTIHATDPSCQFGISPFGVWRNSSLDVRGSNTRGGQTNYDDLYADILLWLKNDWIDYVAPQLYWEIGHKLVDFNTLSEWWAKNSYGKNCYIGIGYYRAGSSSAWRDKTQVPRQIQKIRDTPGLTGMAFYSSSIFEKNPYGWNDSLRLNYFKDSAKAPVRKIDTVLVKKKVVLSSY